MMTFYYVPPANGTPIATRLALKAVKLLSLSRKFAISLCYVELLIPLVPLDCTRAVDLEM